MALFGFLKKKNTGTPNFFEWLSEQPIPKFDALLTLRAVSSDKWNKTPKDLYCALSYWGKYLPQNESSKFVYPFTPFHLHEYLSQYFEGQEFTRRLNDQLKSWDNQGYDMGRSDATLASTEIRLIDPSTGEKVSFPAHNIPYAARAILDRDPRTLFYALNSSTNHQFKMPRAYYSISATSSENQNLDFYKEEITPIQAAYEIGNPELLNIVLKSHALDEVSLRDSKNTATRAAEDLNDLSEDILSHELINIENNIDTYAREMADLQSVILNKESNPIVKENATKRRDELQTLLDSNKEKYANLSLRKEKSLNEFQAKLACVTAFAAAGAYIPNAMNTRTADAYAKKLSLKILLKHSDAFRFDVNGLEPHIKSLVHKRQDSIIERAKNAGFSDDEIKSFIRLNRANKPLADAETQANITYGIQNLENAILETQKPLAPLVGRDVKFHDPYAFLEDIVNHFKSTSGKDNYDPYEALQDLRWSLLHKMPDTDTLITRNLENEGMSRQAQILGVALDLKSYPALVADVQEYMIKNGFFTSPNTNFKNFEMYSKRVKHYMENLADLPNSRFTYAKENDDLSLINESCAMVFYRKKSPIFESCLKNRTFNPWQENMANESIVHLAIERQDFVNLSRIFNEKTINGTDSLGLSIHELILKEVVATTRKAEDFFTKNPNMPENDKRRMLNDVERKLTNYNQFLDSLAQNSNYRNRHIVLSTKNIALLNAKSTMEKI